MPLRFNPACQSAIDLAKRALPDGAELDVGTLLGALYYGGDLKAKYPRLAGLLPQPVVRRRELPAKASLASEVRPVFQAFAERGTPVEAEELFLTLLHCPAGRQFMAGRAAPASSPPAPAAPQPVAQGNWRSSPERLSALQALSSYGRTLTTTELNPGQVVEREETLKALVRTLSKMKRRNAILIGPPGTGKSALIYELSRRIYRGAPSLPARLHDMDVFELSPVFLRSGTAMMGQYDERVKGLLQILQAHPQIILFVDEIHALFHSAVHERTPFSDANESFKGALGRGEITCIGCTTPGEYRHFIEPDRALERRFGTILLEAPSRRTTLAILKARLPRLEAFYRPLRIPEAMLERAVDLTEEYLPARYQPDKSLQLLDEACAWCATSEPAVGAVTEPSLLQALQGMVGQLLPQAAELTEAEVYSRLSRKIIGQEPALREIAKAFVAGLGKWSRRSGPRGVFLFAGPTGVGKTETALLLGRILGGDRDNLVRVDCNTLQGSFHETGQAINRLLGVPPGYLGYARGQGGLLSRIRDFPQSVLLFDECEKAGPVLGRLLLQIIDEGKVEDVDGNVLDFRRAYIIFTTNAGCTSERRPLGFNPQEQAPLETPAADPEAVKRELRAAGLADEFLGRLTHLILFKGLDRQSLRTILESQLESLRQTSETRGLKLVWSEDLVAHLAAEWQPRFGVRCATTMLRHRIGEQLDLAETQGELKGIRQIRLEVLPLPPKAAEPALAGFAARRLEGDTLVISLA
jgi:ATP-dependent Clp protease ATP-binding subunit ClpC